MRVSSARASRVRQDQPSLGARILIRCFWRAQANAVKCENSAVKENQSLRSALIGSRRAGSYGEARVSDAVRRFAKNSLCSLLSSGSEISTDTRFGIAINPLSVSATLQISCSDPTE